MYESVKLAAQAYEGSNPSPWTVSSPEDTLTLWDAKIKLLEDQINRLEQLKTFPIISISVFLLKSQLIEFELTQTIPIIDLHLSSVYRSRRLRRKTRVPKDFDRHQFGDLVREMRGFEGILINKLNQELKRLHKLRTQFTHKLFHRSTDINKLIYEADEGINLANNVITKLRIFQKELK